MDNRKKQIEMEIPRRGAEFAENVALIQNPSAFFTLSLPAVAFCEGWVRGRLFVVSF